MSTSASSIPQALWAAQVPLHITHRSAPSTPFITSVPRFSYLSLLLPRLSAFFDAPCSSFHFEDVQLRNLAVGLLADLYAPSLPWRLVVDDGVAWDIGDTFLNSVKEVSPLPHSFIRPVPSLLFGPSLFRLFALCCRYMLYCPPPLLLSSPPHAHPQSPLTPALETRQVMLMLQSGRLCSLRQRQSDHENVQGTHHSALELGH